ncbi:MAG: thiamine phosphate synthase [Candidatus Acidiferrum sp.]
MSPLNNSVLGSKLRAHAGPILCYLTDRRALQGKPQTSLIEALLEKIESVAAAGVDWIQLREKDLTGKDLAALTREAVVRISNQAPHEKAVTRPPARILVNDRLDVALAELAAGGVHLGDNSLPPEEAKRLVGSLSAKIPSHDFLIGVSCHSLKAAQLAASAGADYIFFGPVFATPSKAAYGAPQGLDRLAEVCGSVAIPVLAIGGITLANASSCFSAGASGIAAIRLFQDSADPAELVRKLRLLPF